MINLLKFSLAIISIIYIINYFSTDSDMCDVCMYEKCSSSYVVHGCGEIQNTLSSEYSEFLNKNTDHDIEQIVLYARVYGRNMGVCFNKTRNYCVQKTCKKECKNKYKQTQQDENFAFKADTLKVKNMNREKMIKIVHSDRCYSENIDLEKMFSVCVLYPSPQQERCIETYIKNASDMCL